jgi:hypothetical protein
MESKLKVPTALDLPKPEERKFDNKIVVKPDRKLQTVDIKFGDLTLANVE